MRPAAALLLFAAAFAPPDARYFRYERPVANTPQRPAQACLALDTTVFAHAAPQLADLRLYSGQTEAPYVVHMAAPVAASEKPLVPINLGRSGGQTVFDAAMPEGTYSDVELAVAAHDFIASVIVSGSRTRAGGTQTRLGTYTIFDLARQKLGRSTVLHLPESDLAYLHFRIAGPLSPESVTGLSVDSQPEAKPKYQTVAVSTQVLPQGRSSVVEFMVAAHVPVDRIAFTVGQASAIFSRDVRVSVSPAARPTATDTPGPPQPPASFGNLLRIHRVEDGQRIDEERLAVDAPTTDFDVPAKWTVTVENGDDPPLLFNSIALQMVERDLCFQADGGAGFALRYGDPAVTAPQYDYATLFEAQSDAALAVLGPERANSGYQPRPDQRPFTERHPGLLWTALGLVLALLGAVALRSAKRATPTPT